MTNRAVMIAGGAADEGTRPVRVGIDFHPLYDALCEAIFPDMTAKDAVHARPAALSGDTFDRLTAAMLNLGCSLKRRETRLRDVRRWELPALFREHASGDVWLVIDRPDGPAFIGEDGAEGAPLLNGSGTFARVIRSKTGEASIDADRQHTGASWLSAVFARQTSTRRGLVLISFLGAGLTMLIPALIAAFYQIVFQNGDIAAAGWFAAAFVLVIAARLGVSALRLQSLAWLAARMHFLVTRSTFRHLLMLPASLATRLEARDQAARVRSFESISEFITSPLMPVLMDLPVAVLAIIALSLVAPTLALILACGCLTHVLIFLVARRSMRVLTSHLAERATKLQHMLIETFSKRDTIRECNLQDCWPSLQYAVIARAQKAETAVGRVLSVTEALGNIVTTATFAVIIVTSTLLVSDGLVGASGQIAAIVLTGFALGPTQALNLSVSRLEQCRKVIGQINEFMDVPAESNFEAAARRLPAIRGNVRLRNISFRPGDGAPLFIGLDLDIAAGQIVGITGAAGTGKSILLQTIQGMITPTFGSVLIEGVDMGQLPLRDLRNAIAYVPQNPVLLPVSLGENLALANPHASPDHVARALRLVGLGSLAADIAALESRYTLPAGSDAAWRFALAQALLVGSNLILIDEIPNAAINAGLGKIVHDVVASARGSKTVIFVSQRIDLLNHADVVVELRYGKQPALSRAGSKPDAQAA